MEAPSSSACSSSDPGPVELPFTAGLLLGGASEAVGVAAGEEASGTAAVVNAGATAGGDTGLLPRKLVDEPKMSGRGSPRTGRLVAPAGNANGTGACSDNMQTSVKQLMRIYLSSVAQAGKLKVALLGRNS